MDFVRIKRIIKAILFDKRKRFLYLSKLGIYNWMGDEVYLRKRYNCVLGQELDIVNPCTFNEKLQWLKIHDRNPEYIKMADKFYAKQFVAENIGEEHIIPTLGCWEHFEDINFDSLPEQFVLKCTHDSGGLVVVRDKNTFDKIKAKKKIEKCLKHNYFYNSREWPYKDIKPQIIAEKYMEDGQGQKGLTDYKFYCFNGKPEYLYVSVGLENHETARISFLNLDWTFADFNRSDYLPLEKLPTKPSQFEKMKEIATQLSKGCPFLRVDLYEINGKVYFGELTFYPAEGMMPFCPKEADKKLGDLLDISKVGRENVYDN